MALRDQPYLPLYVQDYLTDEKLNECSAASQGIYIKILCLMHKSKEYGKILLKQNEKQNKNFARTFAEKLLKHLPFTVDELEVALKELILEDVLQLDEESGILSQKRMVKDNNISIKRSKAGSKGGFATQFAKAKVEANTEYEYENENINENKDINRKDKEKIFEYFINKNYGEEEAEEFYNHYEAIGWVNGSGIPIVNWKVKAENWHKEQTRRSVTNKNVQKIREL